MYMTLKGKVPTKAVPAFDPSWPAMLLQQWLPRQRWWRNQKTSWVAMLVIKKGHRKTMNDTYSVYSTHPPSQADHVRNHCHRLSGFLQYELHTHGILTCADALRSWTVMSVRHPEPQVCKCDTWMTDILSLKWPRDKLPYVVHDLRRNQANHETRIPAFEDFRRISVSAFY